MRFLVGFFLLVLFIPLPSVSAAGFGEYAVRPFIGGAFGAKRYEVGDYEVTNLSTGQVVETGVSDLGYGSGMLAGIDLRYTLSKQLMLEAGYTIKKSAEVPDISNLDAEFTRQTIQLSVLYYQDFLKKARLYAGPGAAYHFNARASFESEVSLVELAYANSLAPFAVAGVDIATREAISLSLALRWYMVEFSGGEVYLDKVLQEGFVPRARLGNGLDITVSAIWYFGGD